MNDLYESLVAWSGGTHRTLGRATSLRGAPRDAVRLRAQLSRHLSTHAVAPADPHGQPEPPSEPATSIVRVQRRPRLAVPALMARRAA